MVLVVHSAVAVAERWFDMSGLLIGGLSALSADPKTGEPLIKFGDDYLTMDELFALDFKGGKSGDEADEKTKIKPPGEDIDMPIRRRKQANMSEVYKPKVQKTFKDGGIVRGCGIAQRGRTRGRIV